MFSQLILSGIAQGAIYALVALSMTVVYRATTIVNFGHGDMVIEIQVETPTRLSSKQRELLEQFRETETGDECPAAKGFFARVKDMLGA